MKQRIEMPYIFLSIVTICALLTQHSVIASEENPGKQIYEHWCAACHMDSPFAAGTIQLKQTRGADKAVIERRTDLTEPYVRALVRQGFAGMPKFRRTEISDAELDALVKYLVRP